MSLSPEECPDASVHGNPFRYCPSCSWVEEPEQVSQPADQYLNRAKKLAAKTYSENMVAAGVSLAEDDVYVVWFCKTLGNWKALVSTDAVSGVYLEVTHNGAKQETYVDLYLKTANRAWPDA